MHAPDYRETVQCCCICIVEQSTMPMPVAPDYRESESFSQIKILISGRQSAPCICPKTRRAPLFVAPARNLLNPWNKAGTKNCGSSE